VIGGILARGDCMTQCLNEHRVSAAVLANLIMENEIPQGEVISINPEDFYQIILHHQLNLADGIARPFMFLGVMIQPDWAGSTRPGEISWRQN